MKVKIIELLCKAVLNNIPEHEILKKIRGIIQNTPDFNIREKAALYKIVKKTADLMYFQNGKLYNGQIKEYSTGINKVEEHRNARLRKQNLVADMRTHRADSGVFYMSSIHSNPAPDHAAYQGKILMIRIPRRGWQPILEIMT